MKLKKFFPIIGVAILVYIIIRIEPQKIVAEIKEINFQLFSVAIFLTAFSLITQTAKWFIIAKTQKINVGFWNAFKINIIGFFYGFITPAKVGTVMRADYLKKYTQGDLNPGVNNFIIDKIFDLLSLVVIVVIFSFVFKEILPVNYFYLSLLILAIFITMIMIFKNEERSKKILRVFYNHFIPSKVKDSLKDKFYSFYRNGPLKRYYIIFLIMSMINWVVLYLSIYFIGLSLGINISFLIFLAVMPIATLVGYIPITISGLGTREAVLIGLMGLFAVESTKVLSMSLLNIFIGGIIPSIIAIFLIIKIGNKTDEETKPDYSCPQ